MVGQLTHQKEGDFGQLAADPSPDHYCGIHKGADVPDLAVKRIRYFEAEQKTQVLQHWTKPQDGAVGTG